MRMTRAGQLRHFIAERWEAGDNETELLAVEGLKYLKRWTDPGRLGAQVASG